MGDLDLYKYCLPKLANFFFTFNHHNYSKWIVRYHDNLMRLNTTHPEVHAEFKKGCFSLRRTKKPFSVGPIDLALEQTINADAASQRTGIASITKSISARQRWAESHSVRTSIISTLFDQLGMSKQDDSSRDLKPNQMRKNASDMSMITSNIEQTMNPFSDEICPDYLYNIGSGKAAKEETAHFLLNCQKIGSVLLA